MFHRTECASILIDSKIKQKIKDEIGVDFGVSQEIEGGINTIYELKTEEDTLILKVHTNENSDVEWFRAEPQIYNIISNKSSIPSPRVVCYDFSEGHDPFYLMEKMEGFNGDSLKEKFGLSDWKPVFRELGEMVAEVHNSYSFEEYGNLEGHDEEIVVSDSAEKWTWSFYGTLEELKRLIEERWENPPEIEIPTQEEVDEILPENPESVILHTDNRLENVLIKDGQVSGFLDWSYTRSGHDEYNFVKAEYLLCEWDFHGKSDDWKSELRSSFRDGYTRRRELELDGFEERRRLYRFTTVIWIAAGFPNWGEGLDENSYEEMRERILGIIEEESF